VTAVKFRICLILALLCPGIPALAQMNLFVGLSVQAATGYQTVSPYLSYYKTSGAYTESQNSTGYPLTVSSYYTWSVSDRVIMGAGYERNLKSTNAGSLYYYNGSSGTTSSMGFKNQAQFSLIAGHLIKNDGLLYAKLGYASVDTTNASNNFSMNGYGTGVGYKTFLNPFQFVFTEFNYTKMADTTVSNGSETFRATATGKGAVLGMGWQF
jgi:hypothetical protein